MTAMSSFNDGVTNIPKIIRVLKMDIGTQTNNFCNEADVTGLRKLSGL